MTSKAFYDAPPLFFIPTLPVCTFSYVEESQGPDSQYVGPHWFNQVVVPPP